MPDRKDDDLFDDEPRRKDPRAVRRRAQPPSSAEGVRILGSDEEAQEAVDSGSAARRRGPDEKRFGDVPSRPDPDVRPAVSFPLRDDEQESWSASSERSEGDEGQGTARLPHWTEPPTGEVPRLRPDAEAVDADEDELDAWRSISGSTPRYRTEAGDWAEGDFAEGLKDDEVAVGALADHDEVDDDAEFEESLAARRRPRRGGGRGGRGPSRDRTPPARGGLEGNDVPKAEPAAGADLTTRVLTGVAIGVAALIMLALGRGPATLLVMAIAGVAAFELYVGFQRVGYQPATVLGLLGCVAIVWVGYKEGLHAFPLVGALVVVFTMLWYMAEVVKARPLVNTAITVFVFAYVGVLAGFAGVLLSARDGTGIIIGLAICAVGYDVFGFFIGSQFGRSRMAPRLSPNKTWEGLFGGMAASLILGGIVSNGLGLAPWDGKLSHGLALGLVVAIMAPVGDLCESMIKRDLGVKDLGTLLPGHGGILDRFDAILFCLPAVFYLVIHLGIGG